MSANPSDIRGSRWGWIRQGRRPWIGFLLLGVAMMVGAPLVTGDAAEEPTGDHGHQAVTDDHGEAGDHAGAGHHDEGVAHPPTLVSILAGILEGKEVHDPEHADNPVAAFLTRYTGPIFSAIAILALTLFFGRATRKMTLIPGKLQNVVEMIVEGFDGFVKGVIGPEGGRFVPFLGTLFLYIYLMNVMGLIPGFFSPTSMIETTLALAICVFLYTQFVGFQTNGFLGYIKHLAGDPKGPVEWGMVPLMFPLHVIGEIAKPISLSLRLFGNVMGGETLLAVFMGLGVSILAFSRIPIGIPLQVPFIFLELLVTLVQALVFTLLATIYFALVLPHHEEAH